MAEQFPSQPERIRINHETTDLSEGPIDLYLCTHHLQIVDVRRDLGENGWRTQYAVIDPEEYNIPQNDHRGYKGLWEETPITLGRSSTYDRFTFPDDVSRHHVQITKIGDAIEITDLGSTNGTFLSRPQTAKNDGLAPTTPYAHPETQQEKFSLAGVSIESDTHHNRNQDAYYVDQDFLSLGVFDGVSSAEHPEIAASVAAAIVSENLRRIDPKMPVHLGHLAVTEALQAAHETINRVTRTQHIQTTATVAKIFETPNGTQRVVIGSAGDSRAYLRRGDNLQHLTLDHVYRLHNQDDEAAKRVQQTLAEVTDLSQLTPEEAASFDHRNIITSGLGGLEKRPLVSVADYELKPGDQIILTTDGVHDNLTDREILTNLQEASDPEVAVHRLVYEAQRRSRDRTHIRAKADDMTAAMLQY